MEKQVNEDGLTPEEQEHEEKRELLMKDFDTDPRSVARLEILQQMVKATWEFTEENLHEEYAFILGGYLQSCKFILDHVLAELETYDLPKDDTTVEE